MGEEPEFKVELDTRIHTEEKFFKSLKETFGESPKDNEEEKQPVWEDEDDEGQEVRLAQKRSYTKSQAESSRKFKKFVGEPSWVHKQEESSDDEDSIKYTGKLEDTTSAHLREGIIGIKKLKNLNRSTYSEKNITSIVFHPTSTVAIASGLNGIVNIYAVDGKKNDKLHSVAFKDFQVTQIALLRGQELIVGGKRPFFHTYDLMTSKSTPVYLPKSITKLKQFAVSPDERLICVKGRFGEIHLLDSKTKELIKTMKQEYNASGMNFSEDSSKVFCHSVSNEISVFDLKTFRLAHKFVDDGCIAGRKVQLKGETIATGSAEGVVNVYETANVLQTQYPAPRKSIFNLTTQITEMQFNCTGELLAVASEDISDAVKLIHLPSATVFSNFPGALNGLGKPTAIAFSPKSGFMALGNTESTISLFRLKHYSNY